MIKNVPASVEDTGEAGSILGSGRSPGEGNGYPLQYSCLGNSMDKGAWQAIIHGVTESDTTEQLTLLLLSISVASSNSFSPELCFHPHISSDSDSPASLFHL